MATIIYSSYVVRYPVGGVLSSNLQYLHGFCRLGHEVVLVETAGWPGSCFDPFAVDNGDDPAIGLAALGDEIDSSGLRASAAFVDLDGGVRGMGRDDLSRAFERADLFIERGQHNAFVEESGHVPRVLIDPDPGYRQIQMEKGIDRGGRVPEFDAYFTYGRNIGTDRSPAPTAGVEWRPLFHPVDTTTVPFDVPDGDGPFTTVMNWRSMPPLRFDGREFGMKDVEFPRFEQLPARAGGPFGLAVSGGGPDRQRLEELGWRVTEAVADSKDLAGYHGLIGRSLGEFSVLKQVYVDLDVGWFSDRSAWYLARGRPVIVQDNGLEGHLPLGEGLFSVRDVDEAARAVEAIRREPERHASAARHIAETHLDTSIVLSEFLRSLGLQERGDPCAHR